MGKEKTKVPVDFGSVTGGNCSKKEIDMSDDCHCSKRNVIILKGDSDGPSNG